MAPYLYRFYGDILNRANNWLPKLGRFDLQRWQSESICFVGQLS